MEKLEYSVVKSDRRTIAIQIKDGQVIVRAPRRVGDEAIEAFVVKHRKWIDSHMARLEVGRQTLEHIEPLTEQQLRELYSEARRVIPRRVDFFAEQMGVRYGRVTVRCQRTRWGSCSRKGNLNFNCLLMLTPPEVLDSVVVHELCHLRFMDHSKRFYDALLSVFPEYHRWNKWLKRCGGALFDKLPR